MSSYEMTLLYKNDADRDAVKEAIGKAGGAVFDERTLGERQLAYPIKKERTAKFTLLRFNLDPSAVLSLSQQLKMSGRSLRHMITATPARVAIKAPGRAVKPALPSREEAEPAAPAKVAVKRVEVKSARARQKAVEAELEKLLKEV